MASHQLVVTTLRVVVQGNPTRPRLVEGGIIPKGTIGWVEDSGATDPWETERLYNFYPNNFSETPSAASRKLVFVVLAEDVVYRPDSRSETRTAMSISIVEAGFTQIRHVFVTDNVRPLDRCAVVGRTNGTFDVVPITDVKTKPFFVGRLLHSHMSESPLLYSSASATHDVEIFRVRPIVTNSVEDKLRADGVVLASNGTLEPEPEPTFTNPAESSADEY